jgi:subtilase family serine protease
MIRSKIERKSTMDMKRSPRSFFGRGPFICAATFLLFPISALAQQLPQMLTKHVRPEVSSGQAALVGPLSPTQHMQLAIVLPLRNQAELTSLLSRLYNPSSPDYHKFLSVAQFTDQFGPTAESYQTVVRWAQSKGLSVVGQPANRLLVPIEGSVPQINSAFNISMNTYKHPTENRTFFSPDREPSIDLDLPVVHIVGLNNFSEPHPAQVRSGVSGPANTTGSGPGGYFLPADMRAAYYGGTALTGSGQSVGLVEFGGYNIGDVTGTFNGAATSTSNGSNYVLSYSTGGNSYNVPINNVLLDGATGGPEEGDDSEQALDIAQAIGMAPGLSQVRVYIAPEDFVYAGSYVYPAAENDTLILNTIATENICKQISISWNWTPEDITTNDGIFQQFAAQGQSFFAASGDYGSWNTTATYVYPEEDPYVVAVGGTSLTTTGPGGSWVSETAWNDNGYSSGGGISPNGVTIPSWQSGLNGVNGASTTLRNGPDVAMQADQVNYFCDMGTCATTQGEGGTSYAAPRWAGFMALVNQQAVENGTLPAGGGLGFINPTVYAIGESSSYASDFHDITSGCNSQYCAGTGYDLVTGWGSPNGQNAINALAGLPPGPAWDFYAGLPVGSCGPGTFSLSVIQQSNASSLYWSYTITLNNTFMVGLDWSLYDNQGELYIDGPLNDSTGSSGTFTVSRAPVGTPTLRINGQVVQELSGCDTNINETVTGNN